MSSFEYCIPIAQVCMAMSDWKDATSIVGTFIAVPGVLFAAYKAWREVQRMGDVQRLEQERHTHELLKAQQQREAELAQRQREHELRRAEFTLAQHRRLFDDPDLKLVLKYLDGDQSELATQELIQPKRKFLTFFEELLLLRRSGYITREVSLYTFGYYAAAAHSGVNFKWEIAYEQKYWKLFIDFAEEARLYLDKFDSADVEGICL